MALSLSQKSNFRYDINALRCIAILGVLFFHFKLSAFEGGFSGVDVFFVISGYLMTRIIVHDLRNDKFSILGFYSKRAQRIIPALLVLILVLTAVCFFIYFPSIYQEFLKNAASASLFVSNIRLYQKVNYFNQGADTNLLLHTWSLSVEWQFYLLYPVCLFAFNEFSKGKIKALTASVLAFAVLFAFALWLTAHNRSASFYLLPSRAWEMLAGGVAFYLDGWLKSVKLRKGLAITGYAIIIAGYLLLDSAMYWPGFFTLVPVLATMLVIAAGYNDFSILKSGIIQQLGKISYSLYLWHWPVYVLAQYRGIQFSWMVFLAMSAISVTLAWLSYRYVETLKIKKASLLYVAAGCVCALAIVMLKSNLNEHAFKKESIQLSRYADTYNKSAAIKAQFGLGTCFISSAFKAKDYKKEECLALSNTQKNVLLIGDSHGAELTSSLRAMFKRYNINMCQATASGCSPLLNTNGASDCSEIMNFVYHDFIKRNASQINTVILNAQWIDKGTDQSVLTDIRNTINYLKQYHLKVIVLGQTKAFMMPYPLIAAQEQEFGVKLSHNFINKRSTTLNTFLSKELGKDYLDIYGLENFPVITPQNMPYMFDKDHFTQYGANEKVKAFWPMLVGKALW